MSDAADIVLDVRHVTNRFDKQVVHDDISFTIARGEIIGLVGGSGAGKSVMLRTMTGLRQPSAGEVRINQQPLHAISPAQRAALFGVLFQEGALFSSLTVAENIMLPMREHTDLTHAEAAQLACYKLALVGLDETVATKYPSELSGGMTKRVALARALALDPPILFLDEPTAGLDPVSATAFDHLIATLNQTLGVTILMITHDLDSLFTLCHRVAMLVDKKITIDSLDGLLNNPHPWIHEYLHGPRARGAMMTAQEEAKNGE